MFGICVEYGGRDLGAPDQSLRQDCRAVLVRQPGYRRRLALMADGWRRAVDFFLFADADAARAALACADWRALASAHPACRDADPALLASECPYGGMVVLLRAAPGSTCRDSAYRRDRLTPTEPGAVLW